MAQARKPAGTPQGGQFAASDALATYKENAFVNDWLRGDRSPSAGDEKTNRVIIPALDNIIANSHTSKPVTVYRGYGTDELQSLLNDKGILSDKGYTSTSLDPSIARGFSPEMDAYVAKIDLPAGHPAYQFPNDHQKEVLLPRGSKFRVNGINHQNKTINLVPHSTPVKAAA